MARENQDQGLQHISRDLKNPAPRDIETALNGKQAETGEEFTCQICHDFHYVHPRVGDKVDYSAMTPCRCVFEELARKRAENLLRYCELPPGSQHMTFDNFKMRPQLELAYTMARELSEGGPKQGSIAPELSEHGITWLTLMCGSQRGKTHLAIAIVRRWIERGIMAKYVHVPLLMEELRRGFRKEGDDSYEAR
ncbi:unnamed protein product, partial [marine sediment metagenome]